MRFSRNRIIIGVFTALIFLCAFPGWFGTRHPQNLPASGAGAGVQVASEPANVGEAKERAVPHLLEAKSHLPGGEVEVVNESLSDPRADKLLAKYELSGEAALLDKIQKMFPRNEQVIVSSALTAKSPSSKWLEKMEHMHSRNSAPNLVRAGLYAEAGDKENFIQQLALALTKEVPDTYSRERYGRLLDYVLANGDNVLPQLLVPQEDLAFEEQLSRITHSLLKDPWPLGSDLENAATVIALAEKLRQSKDRPMTFELHGDYMEDAALRRLRPDDEYGDSGKTVGKRQQELKLKSAAMEKDVWKGRSLLFATNPDPILRLQFLIHMQADGDRDAFAWLLKQAR